MAPRAQLLSGSAKPARGWSTGWQSTRDGGRRALRLRRVSSVRRGASARVSPPEGAPPLGGSHREPMTRSVRLAGPGLMRGRGRCFGRAAVRVKRGTESGSAGPDGDTARPRHAGRRCDEFPRVGGISADGQALARPAQGLVHHGPYTAWPARPACGVSRHSGVCLSPVRPPHGATRSGTTSSRPVPESPAGFRDPGQGWKRDHSDQAGNETRIAGSRLQQGRQELGTGQHRQPEVEPPCPDGPRRRCPACATLVHCRRMPGESRSKALRPGSGLTSSTCCSRLHILSSVSLPGGSAMGNTRPRPVSRQAASRTLAPPCRTPSRAAEGRRSGLRQNAVGGGQGVVDLCGRRDDADPVRPRCRERLRSGRWAGRHTVGCPRCQQAPDRVMSRR